MPPNEKARRLGRAFGSQQSASASARFRAALLTMVTALVGRQRTVAIEVGPVEALQRRALGLGHRHPVVAIDVGHLEHPAAKTHTTGAHRLAWPTPLGAESGPALLSLRRVRVPFGAADRAITVGVETVESPASPFGVISPQALRLSRTDGLSAA